MMNAEDKNKFDKFLSGTADIEEQSKVENLLSSDKDENYIRSYISNDWDEYLNSEITIDKNLDGLLLKIHKNIHQQQDNKNKTLVTKIVQWYSAAAAVIVVPLLLAGIFGTMQWRKQNMLISEKSTLATVVSPPGSRVTFELPDGSTGVLNGGSSIEYEVPFVADRNIKLTGEAFFDVKHDEEHPFRVRANLVELEVLGTQFNVFAFPGEDYAEVVLETGKVECATGSAQNKVILKPDERLVISKGKGVVSSVNAVKYNAWREGKLVFRGDSMDEVARRISRWYNVDVEVQDKELFAYSFRATFQDEPLTEVLRLLKLTSPVFNYRIEKRKSLQDGTFSKTKVIFFKKN